MRKTTLGQVLINRQLPEDLRDYDRVLDKRGVSDLLRQVAEKYPDRYREIVKDISDVGRQAAFTTGGHSFGLGALRQSLAGRKMRLDLGAKLKRLYAADMPPAEKQQRLLTLVGDYQKKLVAEVEDESAREDNPLYRQLKGAGRGNKFGLNALRGADLLYTDHNGKVVPIPVLRNYSMGMRPHEYFAGSFGARKGVIDTKQSTADAGFLAKQLVQASHRLVVTGDDDEEYDEATPRGFVVDTDDADNEGALLAYPVGEYGRNTLLSPKILKELKEQGHDRILVRSPTVGGPEDGGVYARDVGRRERGGVAPVGDYVGIAAAQALAEPITQSQLSSKHSGGVAGASAGSIGGFKYINQLIQTPKVFKGGAAHSRLDGKVTGVREAPQGGHYVKVGNEEHYVGPDYQVTVAPGDDVEAGDTISEGIPNPAEIVRHKGVGEGRRYFIQSFRKALEDSGTYGNRRNIELLARGLINHVRLTDEVGDWAPDDVIPYQILERQWKPREGHRMASPKQAVGHYLERPVLHHTVGTKVRPSMIADMEKFGVKEVPVHAEAPPFAPEMIRGMANVAHDPDWMTRMLGSYQSKSLLEGVRRGAVSDTEGTSYVPGLAAGVDIKRTSPPGGLDVTRIRNPPGEF